MSVDQKQKFLQETVQVILDATYVKEDFSLIDGFYVVLVEGGVINDTRAGILRGVFEIPKASAATAIARGDAIEYVAKNSVQKYAAGTKVGRAMMASASGTETVLVELNPAYN